MLLHRFLNCVIVKIKFLAKNLSLIRTQVTQADKTPTLLNGLQLPHNKSHMRLCSGAVSLSALL